MLPSSQNLPRVAATYSQYPHAACKFRPFRLLLLHGSLLLPPPSYMFIINILHNKIWGYEWVLYIRLLPSASRYFLA